MSLCVCNKEGLSLSKMASAGAVMARIGGRKKSPAGGAASDSGGGGGDPVVPFPGMR